MTRWWPDAFPNQPYGVWFWACRPGETPTDPCEWPTGYYWFYKIAASGAHQEQLAFRPAEDKYYKPCWADPSQVQFRTGVVHIICYPDDTPNWGSGSLVAVAPPCGNWYSNFYDVVEATRSQTFGLMAAIQAGREKSSGVLAAVAKTDRLECGIEATVQGDLTLDADIRAAIMGERSQTLPLRAAVRAEPRLEPGIVAAIGQDFGLPVATRAAIRGNPSLHSHLKAAILGEAVKSSGIIAFVVKSRVNNILVEMENLWPQENDLRSTPNWASKVKDYRKSRLSARDS